MILLILIHNSKNKCNITKKTNDIYTHNINNNTNNAITNKHHTKYES